MRREAGRENASGCDKLENDDGRGCPDVVALTVIKTRPPRSMYVLYRILGTHYLPKEYQVCSVLLIAVFGDHTVCILSVKIEITFGVKMSNR